MTGYSSSIISSFFSGKNRITKQSKWNGKVELASQQLETSNRIKYFLGYPQGSTPTFYIMCDSEELTEHTKDWLNCSLPRVFCQYAKPCKSVEFDFESGLLNHWPHGFLKVVIWNQSQTDFDSDEYRRFIPTAVNQIQEALDEMIARFNMAPNIDLRTSTPIGVLIKDFIKAYESNDHKSMRTNFELIQKSEDLDRRNKDTLKFMILEKEEKWNEIIDLSRSRNISAQVVSSGVIVSVMKAVILKSCDDAKALDTFEFDWPALVDLSTELLPLLLKSPDFTSEQDWKCWALLSHSQNVKDWSKISEAHIEGSWISALLGQDISVSARSVVIEDKLDVDNLEYNESTLSSVLNYSQSCLDSEALKLMEWLENAPFNLKMSTKSNAALRHQWSQLESIASTHFSQYLD
ncbi:hypothetical protein [Vibrio breoganii]|nr:hypothetical protein [Vibrio breoganii]MDN3716544.1 hypothetical protein [Vibrio breoganii]